jgi:hypothetical protein
MTSQAADGMVLSMIDHWLSLLNATNLLDYLQEAQDSVMMILLFCLTCCSLFSGPRTWMQETS